MKSILKTISYIKVEGCVAYAPVNGFICFPKVSFDSRKKYNFNKKWQ